MHPLTIILLFALTCQYAGIVIGMFVWLTMEPVERGRVERVWREQK